MRTGDPMAASQRGFVYVWLLAGIAVTGIALSALGTLWFEDASREREQELIRIGVAYARAIQSYRDLSPGSVKMSPPRLEALLLDDRFPRPHRHLRSLYPDPVDPAMPWGLIVDREGRISGVYSRSAQAPMRRVAQVIDGLSLPVARSYSDWKFLAKDAR